jgi:hypothetical protein
MERARQRLSTAGALDELGAAVTAGVLEHAHASFTVAHGKEWDPGRGSGDEAPGRVEERARTERRRTPAEQFDLGLEAVGRSVIRDGYTPHIGSQIRGATLDVFQHSIDQRLVAEIPRRRQGLLIRSSLGVGGRHRPIVSSSDRCDQDW